jgi:DMSO/TMAO reductase YedYZ molybdopterin-dependent catalytic subunit
MALAGKAAFGATRRQILRQIGVAGVALAAGPAWAETSVDLPLPGGPQQRPIATGFPQKGPLILQRTRPPLLETPFSVFDRSLLTPNELFYVRWHWADIPTQVDVAGFRLQVRGQVSRPQAFTLDEIVNGLPRVELVAVNQCSGNSRGYFQPRVPGGEWSHGAMGNARWTGCKLKDLLDRAGVRRGAIQVRFNGMDGPVVPDAPDFMKSLAIDHARDGEVMIAYAMNGEPLPLLNGFPLRLVVPGWYATYWVKMLNDIEVLDRPDENFWTKSAYLIPDTPHASITPGETGVRMVPINRMVPRSFVTSLAAGARLKAGAPARLRGIAFGGDTGVARVDVSADGGRTWHPAGLEPDQGKYGFRRWQTELVLPRPGNYMLMVRCTNSNGVAQPAKPNWNPAGFMRNVIESTSVSAV